MRRRQRFVRIITIFGISMAIIFLLGRINLQNYPLALLHIALDPITAAALRVSERVAVVSQAIFTGPRLRREVDELREQLRTYTLEEARLLELRAENNLLRSALNFKEKSARPMVVARVVGRIHEGGSTFFTLNKGSADGIEAGLPLVVDQVLIGKIVRVNPNFSSAVPLTTPGIRTAATLAGYEKNAGILEGELNLGAALRFIPKDATIHVGTPIISSGLEDKIPRGLLIGSVERLESGEQDLFQTAYLKIPLRLENVFLISIVLPASISQ